MKILCVGRNYAAHAAELGNEVPKAPLLFIKPDTALMRHNRGFFYPDFSDDIHHELELVVRICKTGKYIKPEFASSYYEEMSVGLDFTARDLQQQCKEAGHPWEIAKAFDNSAAVGEFRRVEDIAKENPNFDFHLLKNGQEQQRGDTSAMIHSINELLVYASRFFTLSKGDLFFTGTPKGVSRIERGDSLQGFLGEEELLNCQIK